MLLFAGATLVAACYSGVYACFSAKKGRWLCAFGAGLGALCAAVMAVLLVVYRG